MYWVSSAQHLPTQEGRSHSWTDRDAADRNPLSSKYSLGQAEHSAAFKASARGETRLGDNSASTRIPSPCLSVFTPSQHAE